jgi:hypothetical protein
MDLNPLERARPWRLVGTGVTDRPFAFIQDTTTARVGLYGIGQRVGHALVREIGASWARLDVAGRGVVLMLESASGGASAISPAQDGGSGAARLAGAPGLSAEQEVGFPVRVQPHLNPETSAFEGLVLESLPPAVGGQVGLQPGDVLEHLNGQRLRTPSQALQVFKKAWQQPALEVGVRRGHERFVRRIAHRVYRRP